MKLSIALLFTSLFAVSAIDSSASVLGNDGGGAVVISEGSTLAIHEQQDLQVVGQQEKSWRTISKFVRMRIHGCKKRPDGQGIGIVMDAFKRAYNIVHAPQADDFEVVDLNITSMEVRPETTFEAANAFESFSQWFTGDDDDDDDGTDIDSQEEPTLGRKVFCRILRRNCRNKKSRPKTAELWGRIDIGCRFCDPDEDDALLNGNIADPMAHIQPVEELFCRIMKEEGDPAIFGTIHDCGLTALDTLATWNAVEVLEQTKKAVSVELPGAAKTLSVSIIGIDCDDDACLDALLRELVSEAIVAAYDVVNFGDDFHIQAFEPTSFQLLSKELDDDAILSSAIRGGLIEEEMRTFGVWQGPVHIGCTLCADNVPEDAPFDSLLEVEDIFCAMMDDIAARVPSLVGFDGCSLAVVEPIVGVHGSVSASEM